MDHAILLEKLQRYGVAGHIHDWFKNYLQDLQERAVVDGFTSRWAPVTVGVPQESLLSPMLVLPNGTLTALYADDTKLYKSISSYLDADKLQQAVLTVTRKKRLVRYDYHLDHVDLRRVNEEKDLDVMITSRLTWETKVLMVTAQANKLLGLLCRTCSMLTDVNVRRYLYLQQE